MGFREDLAAAFPPGTESVHDPLLTAFEVEVATAEAMARADAEQKRMDAETKLEAERAEWARKETAMQTANQVLALKIGATPDAHPTNVIPPTPDVITLDQLVSKSLGKK